MLTTVMFASPVNIILSFTLILILSNNASSSQQKEKKTDSIAILTLTTTRNPVGTRKTNIQSVLIEKPYTLTNTYISFNSHLAHFTTYCKRSVARTLLNRAYNIPSNQVFTFTKGHTIDKHAILGNRSRYLAEYEVSSTSI